MMTNLVSMSVHMQRMRDQGQSGKRNFREFETSVMYIRIQSISCLFGIFFYQHTFFFFMYNLAMKLVIFYNIILQF